MIFRKTHAFGSYGKQIFRKIISVLPKFTFVDPEIIFYTCFTFKRFPQHAQKRETHLAKTQQNTRGEQTQRERERERSRHRADRCRSRLRSAIEVAIEASSDRDRSFERSRSRQRRSTIEIEASSNRDRANGDRRSRQRSRLCLSGFDDFFLGFFCVLRNE